MQADYACNKSKSFTRTLALVVCMRQKHGSQPLHSAKPRGFFKDSDPPLCCNVPAVIYVELVEVGLCCIITTHVREGVAHVTQVERVWGQVKHHCLPDLCWSSTLVICSVPGNSSVSGG